MILLTALLNLNSAYETWIFFPPGQLFDGYDDEYQCPILDEDRVSERPHWTVEQRNTTMSEADRLNIYIHQYLLPATFSKGILPVTQSVTSLDES